MSPQANDVTRTPFDWRLYAEATCAGLTALLPIPFMDLVFEAYFRRKMPRTTSRIRGREIHPEARRELGEATDSTTFLSLSGCLGVWMGVARYILKKLWRKFIYLFSITDATEQVAEYWQRAYLLDHVVRAGHVAPDVDWSRSTTIFEKVLRETDVSPLMSLARQTVASANRVVRLLVRARRHDAAEETDSLSSILKSHWEAAEASLMEVALRYNDEYARSLEAGQPNPVDQRARLPEPDAT